MFREVAKGANQRTLVKGEKTYTGQDGGRVGVDSGKRIQYGMLESIDLGEI